MQESCLKTNFELILGSSESIIGFQFNKLPCGKDVSYTEKFHVFCNQKDIQSLLDSTLDTVYASLKTTDEEERFYIYAEWSALRSVLAQYLGLKIEGIDSDRCLIDQITQKDDQTVIKGILLPPSSLPDFS